MTENGVAPGAVVRYNETGSRWFLAVAKKIRRDDIEVEYLTGKRQIVPVAKVEDFLTYLRSRERVLSLTREALCYVLYGEELARLRQERADEMRRFLRSKGLRFAPDEWSAGARIQIWPDDSHVRTKTSGADAEFDGLLPRWLEPQRLPPGSRDPLGFQNYAESIANDLLPGLTVFTTRIAYYGFIAWAVRELNGRALPPGTTRRELFHRLERAYVLCEFVHHGKQSVDETDCRVIGQRSKSEVLQSAVNNRYRVPKAILKNQESAGAFRLYLSSLESFGFGDVAPGLAADGRLPFQLNGLGNRLVREFEKWVPDGFLDFVFSEKSVDRERLRGWGEQLCMSSFGSVSYRTPFLEGFMLGNSEDAEARYRTVDLLFRSRHLREDYKPKPRKLPAALSEEDASLIEDGSSDDLSNSDVLLDFYEKSPTREIALLQKAAVFELLSLGYSAIFRSAIEAVEQSGRARIARLCDAMVGSKGHGKYWQQVFESRGRLPTARELHDAMFEAETSTRSGPTRLDSSEGFLRCNPCG